MKCVLCFFILIMSSTVFAARTLSLEEQLDSTIVNDDLATAIQLLDKGADPTKSFIHSNGEAASPVMFHSVLIAAFEGKDRIYSEFIRRGVSPNTAVDIHGPKGHQPYSASDYLFVTLENLFSHDIPMRERVEVFYLRMMKDGADPFFHTPVPIGFPTIVLLEMNRVLTELQKRGISKLSWLDMTDRWSKWYEWKFHEDSLLRIFQTVFPLAQQAGVGIYDWANSNVYSDGKIEYFWPAPFAFVRNEIDQIFLVEFIKRGFDMNKAFLYAGQVNGLYSTCSVAIPKSRAEMQILIKLGCKPEINWLMSFLISKDFANAEAVVSAGLDLNVNTYLYNGYLGHGPSTALNYFCETLFTDQTAEGDQIRWLLAHGADPNVLTEGSACIHRIAQYFLYNRPNSFVILQDLIRYNADLNILNSSKFTPVDLFNMDNPDVELRKYGLKGFEFLLKSGARAQTQNALLSQAFLMRYPESAIAMNMLLDHGANPDLENWTDNSAFHYAAWTCKEASICPIVLRKMLKVAPTLLNSQGKTGSGSTPLCFSVFSDGNPVAVDVLLSEKADPKMTCGGPVPITPYKCTEPGSEVRKIFEKHGVFE